VGWNREIFRWFHGSLGAYAPVQRDRFTAPSGKTVGRSEEYHPNRVSLILQLPCDSQAVSAVVSGSAINHKRGGYRVSAAQPAGTLQGGALHQVNGGHRLMPDGVGVLLP
jgi:hypothetical protein